MEKKHYIGIYLYIFMIICIISPIFMYYSECDNLIKSLFYITISGGIGATLYCIRSFYNHIVDDDFDDNWNWWYVFRPLIGFIAGIFFVFIIGGLIGLNTSVIEFNATGTMGYSAIAFLAGFSFTTFANKLNEIMKILV